MGKKQCERIKTPFLDPDITNVAQAKSNFMKHIMIGLVLVVTGLMVIISSEVGGLKAVSQPSPAASGELKADLATLVDGNNTFAIELYHQLDGEKGNIFFSPHSITSAIAMTAAGAKGETAAQMNNIIHVNLDQERLTRVFRELMANLEDSDTQKNRLTIANRLWSQKGLTLLDSFVKLTTEKYGTPIQQLDFEESPEAARITINNWIANQTEQKILNFLHQGIIDSLTRLVLTNAIYFQGIWSSPFDSTQTIPELFTLPGGKQVQVQMMHQQSGNIFGYAAIDGMQILEMCYVGEKLSLVVLLPDDVNGLGQLEEQMTLENLKKWLSSFSYDEQIAVSIPKFNVNTEFDLKKKLSQLGMSLAFTTAADFSGINGQKDLYISAAVHEAFVNVNENGTEAIASSAVIGSTRGGGNWKIFRVDHPFIFIIRDRESGTILFLGRLVNPLT